MFQHEKKMEKVFALHCVRSAAGAGSGGSRHGDRRCGRRYPEHLDSGTDPDPHGGGQRGVPRHRHDPGGAVFRQGGRRVFRL